MRYLDLKLKLKDLIIFSLSDIKNFEPNFDNRRLNEWQEKGYIEKIIRGYYRFTDITVNEEILFLAANKICPSSYISLESALSYYHLIPESVYGVTSVSSTKTSNFDAQLANFSYQSIKPQLMFGSKIVFGKNAKYVIGEIEKVILDYFYLHPELNSSEAIASLRLNREEILRQVDFVKFGKYLQVFDNKLLQSRVALFRKEMLND